MPKRKCQFGEALANKYKSFKYGRNPYEAECLVCPDSPEGTSTYMYVSVANEGVAGGMEPERDTANTEEKVEPVVECKEIADIIGSFGLWQKTLFVAFLYIEFIASMSNFSTTILVPAVPFTCDVNSTYQELQLKNDEASIYSPEFTSNASSCSYFYNGTWTSCRKWNFNHDRYKYSYTEEWNFVCDQEWLKSFSSTVTLFGDFVACLLFGYSSDRFGRQRTLLALIPPAVIGNLLTLFAPNIPAFMVGRFLCGMSGFGGLIITIVLLMELTGSKHRGPVGAMLKFGWASGAVFVGAIAYWLRDSFKIQAAFTVAVALWIPILIFLPESPRWLLLSSRKDGINAAKCIIHKAHKLNRTSVKDTEMKVNTLYENLLKDKFLPGQKYGYFDLMKTPNIRMKTFLLVIVWTITMFVFYALSINSASFGTDPLISFIAVSAVEFPSIIMCTAIIHFKGCKTTMLLGLLFSALIFLVSAIFKIEQNGWSIVISLVFSKFTIKWCIICCHIWSSEIFPTVIRTLGIGSCSLISRISVLLSPFLRDMVKETSVSAMFYFLGALCVFCCLWALILPNTYRTRYPETIEDGEKVSVEPPWKNFLRGRSFATSE